jgi:signal transduction histidine kinase/ActR/RegA family two-component response regulator
VAAVAFFVSDALSRPLRSLAAAIEDVAARRFGNGETGQRNSPILEFDQLLTGFGEMTETLRAQYEDLEAKVSERTRKLGKAMRAAQRTAALARAEDEIRRGYAELAALLNSLDRSLILHEGSRKIAASLKAPLTAVYLTDSDVEHLRLKTFAALDATALDAHLLAPTGLPAEAARRGEAIVLSLAQAAEPLRLGTGVGTVDVAAVAALPLQSSDRLLGVLVVAVLEPLTEPTRAFLANAARQLSVALTNASLFESVRYQSQQLEELNRELRRASEVKSQFLASMSHELRTPLNSILGFTEILLASARDPLSPRQRTAIEKVLGSGRHLLSLINDVLDLSKIEAGRLEAQPEHFGLAALLQECLASVEPQAAAKGLALRGVGLGQAPEVVQDRAKVKQVVLNLLSNAVKFTSEGSVELRVPPERGGIVEIAVADTGIGIAAEDQAMVFEAFRQVDGTATRENGGTGLGLAISRRLAGLLGGSLGIESVPAHGSTFTVRLPVRCPSSPLVADPGAMPAIGGATPAPGGAGPDVLVIDDDRNAVDLIREAVADSGLTVEWAPAATDGLARARTRRPRLILLDLLLHGHDDGWDLLQMLKTDRATCDIPVVVHSVIDNPQRAQQLGAEGVLAKPASPAAVRALLRQFLEEATPSAVAARR